MTPRDEPDGDDVVAAVAAFVDSGLAANVCPNLTADTLLVGEILDLPALLRLVGYLEERYEFTIAPGDLRRDNFATPGRIAAYVSRLRSTHSEVGRSWTQSPSQRQTAA